MPRSMPGQGDLITSRPASTDSPFSLTTSASMPGNAVQAEPGLVFVTPFVSWQQTRALGARWSWSPRAMVAWPLPEGDFDVCLSGPGFDVSTVQTGTPLRIGDPFAMLGLALTHRPSGLEIDLGETVLFPVLEQVSHPGVDRAWVVHLAWRQRAPVR